MHVAIDDTYSSNVDIESKYVTKDRRTNVAVCFPDDQVEHIRSEMNGCIDLFEKEFGQRPEEFHFVEIVNRKGIWEKLEPNQVNLLIASFVSIYNKYRWPVVIQTIDNRTFQDHGFTLGTNAHGLDPSKREDQSLFLLIIRLRIFLKKEKEIVMILDEGRGKPGVKFGSGFFPEWGNKFNGYYQSSKSEPLLQIADFIAYVINRSTNLMPADKRTSTKDDFLRIVGMLNLNSNDVIKMQGTENSGLAEFDAAHLLDRKIKGLE